MANEYRHPKTPEWFCESKYERLSEYSSSQFHDLLLTRREINFALLLRPSKTAERLELFFNNPLDEKRFAYRDRIPARKLIDPIAVIPADVIEVTYREGICCSVIKFQEEMEWQNLMMQKTLFIDGFAPLFIDLNATDKKIESEFKAWLKATKKSRKTGTRRVPSQGFEAEKIRIIEQKIFQFIDLKTWFKINNEKITDSEMARILFPYTKDAEHIKKTVRPNAERSLKFDYMSWLEHEKGNKKR